LNYAVADAKAGAEGLPALGFPKEYIRVLLDSETTKAKIENVFYRDFAKVGSNARVFVYFAGPSLRSPSSTALEVRIRSARCWGV
jgi:hypothetical protein